MEVPYTPDDFEYICAFGQYGYGIVVAAESPYQTLADLVAAAKTDKINFGGTGYPQPLALEAINKADGTKFNFVSYPKTADLITDVLGGFIPFAVADQASFTAYVQGRFHAPLGFRHRHPLAERARGADAAGTGL
jgi:tripartite-type tricarboxylate transporter receptor subunit TctC